MGSSVIQPAFVSGELAPQLYARTDLAKYHSGLATMRNFFVDYRGGASNRAGTQFVSRCKDIVNPTRLIPFTFSVLQTYVLEFGELYMRINQNGAPILEAQQAILAITQSNPCSVAMAAAHGFANNDWVVASGINGMTALNGRTFIIKNVTATTFTLQDLFGNNVDSTQYAAYTGVGAFARVYTVVSPYSAVDLALLKISQSNDVMTITHQLYPAKQLKRLGATNWTFTTASFVPVQDAPTGAAAVSSAPGAAVTYRYLVTAVSLNGAQESFVSNTATVVCATSMSLTVGQINTVTWVAPTLPAQYYNVYRQREIIAGAPDVGEQYGFVGTTTSLTFIDQNILPNFGISPPQPNDPLSTATNYPGCSTYFQQRQTFAGTVTNPNTIYASHSGDFLNMTYSSPSQDSDAITFTLAAAQINTIKHLIAMNDLIALTASGAWKISGGQASDVITPAKLVATPQAYNGCSDVPPLVINYDILYVQAKGSIVRDLSYNFYINVYTGADLTALSSHLFYGHTITEWCWAEEPHKLVWAIREDGMLLGMTYMKEQDVYGWSRHDTMGRFKSVCSVSEGNENVVYFIVERFINGQYVKYVERLHSRFFNGDITQAWFVDCGLSYTLNTKAFTLFPAAAWDANGGQILWTATVAWNPAVGDFVAAAGGYGHVTQVVSAFAAYVTLDVPMQNAWQVNGGWSCTTPISVVRGLDHLEGMTVTVVGDGAVQPSQVVVGGQITLQSPAAAIYIGLPYQAQLQTLYIDFQDSETVQGRRKNISATTVRVADSRGLKVGPFWDSLVEVKERSTLIRLLPAPLGYILNAIIKWVVKAGVAMPLYTGDQRVNIPSQYNVQGQTCVQQDQPFPATVLGIIPEVDMSDGP